ncbi:ryncolin-1-like [Lucilia cuprina]|uniref:ryncolin-1-like n=1 Tax=Lucilia cuprina TaxID=7375 RepID=UPI001F06A6F3|nr:ryncolin-1-like [Lucilia cuprina]
MLKLKTCWYISVKIFIFISIVKSDTGELRNITTEDSDQALKALYKDLKELKSLVQGLKSSNEVQPENDNITKKDLPLFDERFDKMDEICNTTDLPKDCATATACTRRSGIYKIKIEQFNSEPFYVACDSETETGDWLVIQKRQDGSEEFSRDWREYEKGFGGIDGEFFIGLKKLHALTTYNGPQELLIVMEDGNGTRTFAKYDAFAIGNKTESYKLKRLGRYSGTAGNSLHYHIGMKFSTKDRDNDEYVRSCAVEFKGAWWYKNCHHSNLNGKYGDNTIGSGINWKAFRGIHESLPYVKMMIRRSRTI